jgi:hypothetical protein
MTSRTLGSPHCAAASLVASVISSMVKNPAAISPSRRMPNLRAVPTGSRTNGRRPSSSSDRQPGTRTVDGMRRLVLCARCRCTVLLAGRRTSPASLRTSSSRILCAHQHLPPRGGGAVTDRRPDPHEPFRISPVERRQCHPTRYTGGRSYSGRTIRLSWIWVSESPGSTLRATTYFGIDRTRR